MSSSPLKHVVIRSSAHMSRASHPIPLHSTTPSLFQLILSLVAGLFVLSLSWSDFSDPNLFSVPDDCDIPLRLRVNLLYWQGNYFLSAFLALLSLAWVRPPFLLCLLLNALAFVLVFTPSSSKSSLLSSDALTLEVQFTAASAIFLALFGGPRVVITLLVAALRQSHQLQSPLHTAL